MLSDPIVFFKIVLFICLYYLIPKKWQPLSLLVTNYLFYLQFGAKFTFVLICATLLTYVGGWCIHKSGEHRRNLVFYIFFFLNLSILICFKYINFSIDIINQVAHYLDAHLKLANVRIAAPLGLSFYIFQSTTYLGDMYRKKIDKPANFIHYALFVSFFPTVLAGPIQKARDILPQIALPKYFDKDNILRGIYWFFSGILIKIFLADRLSAIVSPVFSNVANQTSATLVLAIGLFAFQIYFDFFSYSVIAIGAANLLGYQIKGNFDRPYLSTSIAEFWRRWHMTLNSWFIEYVYIPLGGSKRGSFVKYRNVLLVFFFSGLWHGASWTFILWGLFNGLFQIVGTMTKNIRQRIYTWLKIDTNNLIIILWQRLIVFALISFTWIFFKVTSLQEARIVLSKIYHAPFDIFVNPTSLNILGNSLELLVLIFAVICFIIYQKINYKEIVLDKKIYNTLPNWLQIFLMSVVLFFVLLLWFSSLSGGTQEFIYFDF